MIPIPASILAIENESDRDFMENIFFSYQRLIYHEIGSILNDPYFNMPFLIVIGKSSNDNRPASIYADRAILYAISFGTLETHANRNITRTNYS